jgi:TrmH family RNA methyltransferase
MPDFGFLLRLRNIFLTLHRKFKTMLSKNKIKFIHSLQLKKFRDESGFFIAEGSKLIHDLANSFDCKLLVYTGSKEEKGILSITAEERILTDEAGLRKVSAQKTPEGILAVFRKPESVIPSKEKLKNQLCLALDDIQNPGNLGTIIRIADWFGIRHIFCSLSTADAYGPKAVQATMGALARVQVHYADLATLLSAWNTINPGEDFPIYGTFLSGSNIYSEKLSPNGIILMGNEGQGISPKIEKHITCKLRIPNFPENTPTSESLNVAVATAIVCSEFRRRSF